MLQAVERGGMRCALVLLLSVASISACEKRSAEPLATAAKRSAPLATDCVADEDCVPAPACCPGPCTGEVINRRDLVRAQSDVTRSCADDQACPSAGSCTTHAYLCVNGTCKLVFEHEPEYRERK